MSTASFFPYNHVRGAVTCQWTLEGAEADLTPSGALRLTEDVAVDSTLKLVARARIAPATFSVVLPEEERKKPPVRVLLVVRSPSCRLRESGEMLENEAGEFLGEISLPGSTLHGEIDATVFIVRRDACGSSPPYASHKGAILAESETQTVLFEEPPMPPGGHLEIGFEVFAESLNSLRRSHSQELFAIDTEGEAPKLWLNEGIPQYAEILQSRARRGLPRRIRDASFETITVQVWTALLASAISSLALTLDGEIEYKEALDSIEQWQLSALTFWAPRLYPEFSNSAQALEALCRAASARERLPEFFERVTLAVQGWASSASVFDGLLRIVNGNPV